MLDLANVRYYKNQTVFYAYFWIQQMNTAECSFVFHSQANWNKCNKFSQIRFLTSTFHEIGQRLFLFRVNIYDTKLILHNGTLTSSYYPQGYGKADHEMTVSILKKTYPHYSITWSDEGYWTVFAFNLSTEYEFPFPSRMYYGKSTLY